MMTEVLHSQSSSSSSVSTPTHNAALFNQKQTHAGGGRISGLTVDAREGGGGDIIRTSEKTEKERSDQLSLLAILVTLFRKTFWMACKTDRPDFSSADAGSGGNCGSGLMEIGWPTDVQHVNHVTFDRFDGFLGLPVEFEPEVSRRAPSASATVFGVSTESMQLSYDQRGNSVPTILLLMQSHLYSQGGLQAEGIFRITAGNSQEEYVRDQLNRGVIPEGIDVHCLAGLVKAWFRELPKGILDSLSSEQVMQCQSEEDCGRLVRLLPPTEAALLDWAINLMADVVHEEHLNKMNARNIAMVFAPNMTQMGDPLSALMYAVQVMNFLKTLVEKTLRERGDSFTEPVPMVGMEPSDDDGKNGSSLRLQQTPTDLDEETIWSSEANHTKNITDEDYLSYSTSTEESDESKSWETPQLTYTFASARKARLMKGLQSQFQEEKSTCDPHLMESEVDTKSKGLAYRGL
ncbi:rho GTPase-activating protein 1-like [Primulina eburnea]|uniref:rho GTPase-activating protein 1-like n=1 Tax=Primulina eburnea TaxID=1245227 RepID=UPI003C6BE5F1